MTGLLATLWSWLPAVDVDITVGGLRILYPAADDAHVHDTCAHVHDEDDDSDDEDPDGPEHTVYHAGERALWSLFKDAAIERGNGATEDEAADTVMLALVLADIEAEAAENGDRDEH